MLAGRRWQIFTHFYAYIPEMGADLNTVLYKILRYAKKCLEEGVEPDLVFPAYAGMIPHGRVLFEAGQALQPRCRRARRH